MPKKLKYTIRRGIEAFRSRTGMGKNRFAANRKKLSARTDGPYVDVMPGIEMPMVIDKNMYFVKAYTESVFEPECLYFFQIMFSRGKPSWTWGRTLDISPFISRKK